MEAKNIIIILLVIAVILAVALGVMFLSPGNAKQDCKIAITSNKTLYEGDNLTVKLTDLNQTPLKNKTVKILIKDKDEKTVFAKTLKTNDNGKVRAKLNLSEGDYSVNATFEGNDNFTANSTTQKLTVEKVVEEQTVSQQPVADNSQSSNSKSEYGSYINDEWVSMSEQEYAERYPALYHQRALSEGKYDKYHPSMYEVDRQNGVI